MAASRYDIVCDQGADLDFTVTFFNADGTLVDLTGGLARMMARTKLKSPAPFVTLDSNGNGITLGGNTGVMTLQISGSVTGAFAPITDAVYDLEFTDTLGRVSRVIEGRFTVVQAVTR